MIKNFFIADPDKDDQKGNDRQLRALLPNMITLGSIVCGLTAIQMGIAGDWKPAVLFILAATILDTLDGAIARLLNASSKFGAELDSLADFLSFGIAPATIMYLWMLNDIGQIGWIATLVFVMASALRLARFNAQSEVRETVPEWGKYFFTGVPAPIGAGLALMPMIIYFQFETYLSDYKYATPIIALWMIVVAAFMVSRMPTFSSKQVRLSAMGLIPTLAVLGLFIALVVNAPWIMLSVGGIIYVALIPVSYRIYKSREKRGRK